MKEETLESYLKKQMENPAFARACRALSKGSRQLPTPTDALRKEALDEACRVSAFVLTNHAPVGEVKRAILSFAGKVLAFVSENAIHARPEATAAHIHEIKQSLLEKPEGRA